ncbi:peptide chain release factor N(5)-glutamine methyltransferase [Myxococcota bacterium]|nr:peptide chain release factor N(5)-glutamine methyltransferase [Myxococcota bacterium]
MAEDKKTWTILGVLEWTKGHFEAKKLDTPRLDAELILGHVLGLQRVMLYARFDQPLGAEELAKIRSMVARRARGEPMAYIVGEREFYGLALEVTPAVLIPRPDTETLVDVALKLLADRARPVLADVGTGSGAIALALAHEKKDARVYALDRSPAALEVATRNTAKHALQDRVTLHESDLLSGLPADAPKLDLVAANLPYIASAVIPTLMRDVRDFEPKLALDGGPDGLDLVRRLVADAKAHLAPGGWLVLEIGYDQGHATKDLLDRAGYADTAITKDLGGNDRVVSGRWGG